MTRILHLSDLHFGRDRPELVGPLVAAVNAAGADLVAISGDLTQRARSRQFRQARAFLDRLAPPWIAVPGNHDIPLHDPLRRLWRPYGNYRRWIGADLEPIADLGAVRVVGLNTATPFLWQRGRVCGRTVARICARISEGRRRFNVILAHHPFTEAAETSKAAMHGADMAIHALADCGADIILSGHLHRWRTEPFVTRSGGAQILELHAGTGISTRHRGEPNDFAILDFAGGTVEITRMAAEGEAPHFAALSAVAFRHEDGVWARIAP